eukprot:superscaffoldBa00000569_g5701
MASMRTPVVHYSKYMIGVDTFYQMLGTQTIQRKIGIWYNTLFHDFVDMALANSYVLQSAMKQERHMTHQGFQEKLSAELMKVLLDSSPLDKSSNHLFVPISQVGDKSQRASMGHQQCAVCKRSTPWKCLACFVPMCVQLDWNFYYKYHKH